MCDKLAATKTYAKKDYNPTLPLMHWQKYGNKVKGNPKSMQFIEQVFLDLINLGEKKVLCKKYMKKTYRDVCLNTTVSEDNPDKKG